jgi:phosphoribosylformylglycinamidine cyclo-ligase
MSGSYARSGVDAAQSRSGVGALVSVLATIDPGRPSLSVLASGHYASVLEIAPGIALALSTDGVGSKLIVAEQAGRLDTVGIDCVAMNANDVLCVGAEPIALLDYLAVERVDPDALAAVGLGLKVGAELAGVEIPGGELAVLPEIIRGHPSPHGLDLCATCVGRVATDRVITGSRCAPGDALVGVPSSGLHSNGYTLARRVIADSGLQLADRPPELHGRSVADALLEPTLIYVRAVSALLAPQAGVAVHGLAHITGDGVLNLLRLHAPVGYEIDAPLPVPAVCRLVCERGGVEPAEAYEVFNMGCGFVCVVPEQDAERAVAMLAEHHPGTAVIGRVTDRRGRVDLPGLGLAGDERGLSASEV